MDALDNDTVGVLALIVAGLGSLNWGLDEFFNFNLLTEFVSSGTTEYQAVIAVVAIGGVLDGAAHAATPPRPTTATLARVVAGAGPDARPLATRSWPRFLPAVSPSQLPA